MSYFTEHRDLFEPSDDPALDLVNTLVPGADGLVDLLLASDDLEAWLQSTRASAGGGEPGFHTVFPVAPPERRRLLDEARRLRAAIRDMLASVAAATDSGEVVIPDPAGFAIDRVLAEGRVVHRFVTTEGPPLMLERLEATGPMGVLAPIALAAARLAVEADPARLRTCAADGCPRWFLDTSKGGRRRWCSMATCGNRAKAARFRERHAPRG